MSLRNQISIRILLISFCILILGSSFAIWQARKAVSKEVDSSIYLALQLIKIGVGTSPLPGMNETDWIYRLSALEQTRHLNIQIKKPSGQLVNITRKQRSTERKNMLPRWFVDLVISDYPEAEYQIRTYDNNLLTLIIKANPLDEITEVWNETVAYFAMIVLLIILTFLAVHLVFNKTLREIRIIVESLKLIETGEYHKKLPDFATQEYGRIAKAINHMTAVLDSTQLQNRALTQNSLAIQEDERQHLSQELHDEFGQSLTAIKVMAVTAAQKGADTEMINQSIVEICDHLMTVVRSMMKQLHPLILTELGLKATLQDLVSHWKGRNPDVLLTLKCGDTIDSMDDKITIQVFRVIQECLTNIFRHANATLVTISLEINQNHPGQLELLVTDNGKGCDIDSVSSGFGLQGMKERIKSLGGDFELQSQPGEGMKINARIPI